MITVVNKAYFVSNTRIWNFKRDALEEKKTVGTREKSRFLIALQRFDIQLVFNSILRLIKWLL